jgi:hypothetical protein
MTTFKKTFSFTTENKDVYDWLQNQDNASAYIARIVRADMQKEDLESKVKKIVDEYMDQKGPQEGNDMIIALGSLFK